MSEAKHTKGPWKVGLADDWYADGPGDHSSQHVLAGESKTPIAIVCASHRNSARCDQLEANALLIAAAPALFDALKALDALYVWAWDTTEGALWFSSDSVAAFEQAHERARTAIAKALGEPSHG